MLQYMANENMDEFAHDFRVTIETIRAVVGAFGGNYHSDSAEAMSDIPQQQAGIDDERHAGAKCLLLPITMHGYKGFAEGDLVIVRDCRIFEGCEVVAKAATSEHQS